MSKRQPGAIFGSYRPSIVTASCPVDGLPGRRVGSTAYSFRCDNNHHFDSGASTVMPAKITLTTVVAEELNAKNFVDEVTGVSARP